MNYNYTAYYKTDEERIKAISEDILSEYPNLGNLAIEAAKLEQPFGRVHEDYDQFSDDENHINRLIDIVIVTEGKPEFQTEYKRACEDLLKNYENWRRNFTYANPEEQSVYLVMQNFYQHTQDKEVPLITVNQASIEQAKKRKEKELKHKADILRNKFPILGKIADEVIKLEDESGIWIRFQENDIIRLVYAIKLMEGKEEYAEVYSDTLKKLSEMYSNWLKYETYYMDEEKEMVVEMMNRLSAHLEDKNIPISTYAEIKEEFSETKKLDNYCK